MKAKHPIIFFYLISLLLGFSTILSGELLSTMFVGELINFGYWHGKIDGIISINERIESEKELYRYVAKKLAISRQDRILEIGCGLGFGTVLVFQEFKPAKIIGIDPSKSRVVKNWCQAGHSDICKCPNVRPFSFSYE